MLFNHIKGVQRPHKPEEVDENWLTEGATKLQRQNWQAYLNHYQKAGVEHPKAKYPVLFGKGDNRYPGMLATDDIKPGEIIVKVPSKLIINTKKAYFSELLPIFREHPSVFGYHLSEGDDNVLYAFLLHEI